MGLFGGQGGCFWIEGNEGFLEHQVWSDSADMQKIVGVPLNPLSFWWATHYLRTYAVIKDEIRNRIERL